MTDKKRIWEETWNRYVDSDLGVRETVTALNLIGINTTASCEGHGGHGFSSAWVDVIVESTEELSIMNKKADELLSQAEHLLKEMPDHSEALRLMSEYEVVKDQILEKNLQETLRLGKLLEEFYQNRLVSFRVKLVINVYGRGVGRVISQGGLFQEAFPKAIQEKYLGEYLQEMQSFGKWLKKRWIKSGP